MTFGATVVRVVIGVIGAALLIGGLAMFFIAGPWAGFGGGLWLVIGGAILLVGVLLETTRYRSQAAEHTHLSPGPGGGEPAAPEPRFRPTEEIFVDPTSNRRMRVYLDQRTGERRYVAEG